MGFVNLTAERKPPSFGLHNNYIISLTICQEKSYRKEYFLNMQDSFIFYRSFFESIKELEPETRLQIYEAIAGYALNDTEADLSGVSAAIFTLIKPQILANQKRKEQGKSGGRPKKETVSAENKKPMVLQNAENKKPNVNDNVNVNVNDNVVKKEIKKEKKSAEPSFNEIIERYTENEKLRHVLKEHLKTRKAKKATLTPYAIKLSLKKLDILAPDNDDEKIKIVETAIERGWTSFYELWENQTNGGNQNGTYQQDTIPEAYKVGIYL